jgi:glutamyl-tRNA reductase
MILSTCNRVEIIGIGDDLEAASLRNFVYQFHSLKREDLDTHFYDLSHRDVVRHLFRVASSLDSMVVGEPQILFQLKEAFRTASEVGSVGKALNTLLPRAFFVAKRVRTETEIATSAVSVSSVAVELAAKIFGKLEGKTILMVGAGKMGELAGRSLVDSGISDVFVTNRTPEKGQKLARKFSGRYVPFSGLQQYLTEADIVLVSTGASSHVLTPENLAPAVQKRKYRPLFIIDISVPRNVDPKVNGMSNVFLYDIDDLQSVIDANLGSRVREAELAEQIVEEEVSKFFARLRLNRSGPVIAQLRKSVEELCLEELHRNRNGMDPDQYRQLERILLRAAHKFAHPLIASLKDPEQSPEKRLQHIELLRQAFSLDDRDE